MVREQTLTHWGFVFHRDGSQVLEDTVLGGKFTSQMGRECNYNSKLCKGTSLRGGSGAYCQVLAGTNNKFLWQC